MDRNAAVGAAVGPLVLSLSARRAWIEIAGAGIVGNTDVTSLSARRAWIEMLSSP